MSRIGINNQRKFKSAATLVSCGATLLSIAWLAIGGTAVNAADTPSPNTAVNPIEQQRQHYLEAEKALKQGHLTTYRQHLQHLDSYPLKVYLEYDELRRRLYRLPYEDVDQFIDQQSGTYLGDLLNRRWLSTLYRKEHWHDYQSYYSAYPNSANRTDQQCQYLLARLYSGDETALREVEPLWNVGKSQPDECDPLFKAWMEAGYLSDDLAWQRFDKAIGKRQITLARYLLRRMPKGVEPLASLYYEVDRYPHRIKQSHRFTLDDPRMETIIHHGIRRYARRDAPQALQTWEKYDAKIYFDETQRHETKQYLLTQLARKGHMDLVQNLLPQTQQIDDQELIEWLIRDALRSQDWQRAYDSLQYLSQEEQQSERWLYWRARALEQLNLTDPNYPTPRQIYASLALTRDFYGFLSADKIGQHYSIIHRPVQPSPATLARVAAIPAMQRAGELLIVGKLNYARREWFYAIENLQAEELLAAGKLAEQWSWYRQSIHAMAQARHWDDIQLRFPLAYSEEVDQAAQTINEPPAYLYAIARQESAFAADARSPAGAMGLMQLMPATARQTAKKIGVKYRYWDLIKPQNNIQLGSSYLEQMLDEFGGNRILATAAYNAGPHRVKQWLSDPNAATMPYDIWIETIPFRETRGYVQKVLAYSVIYNHRLGNESPMLPDFKDGTQIVSLEP